MGLDYSMTTYVAPEQLPTCLKWLYHNSYNHQNETLGITYRGENLLLKGTPNRRETQTDVEQGISFSTSLVFDIDPHIIGSLAHWNLADNPALLDDFRESFQQAYLGEGKIRIGGFDASIQLLQPENIFCVDFTAVTTEMSQMLRDSPSVKQWLLALSRHCNTLLTCIDMESEGSRILFSRGQEVDITVKEPFDAESSPDKVGQVLADFLQWSFGGR